MPVFLVHSIKTRMFNHSTHLFNFVIIMGLLVCTQALTQAACIANTLRVLTARYVFTLVCRVHYLSSSNSPVPVRIGNYTSKLTTTDSAIPLYACSRINPVIDNNRSGTLVTMWQMS